MSMKPKHHIQINLYNLATLPTNTTQIKYPEKSHESLFQSYQLLETLIGLLDNGTPPHVAMGIIDSIRDLGATLEALEKPDAKPKRIRHQT